VGLIGNPSDGYGGKTIAFTLRNFHAEVVLYPWDQIEIIWSEQDKSRFKSIGELVEDVDLNGYYGGVRLVKATIKRFAEYCRDHEIALQREPFSVRYTTDIPRGVGLSGSSAIIVATLRCLLEYYGVHVDLPVLASLARAVENDELGIACGYQDRVAQVYQGLVYMDFAEMADVGGYPCGHYERIDASLLPPLFLIYDVATSKTSQSVHGPLRTRVQDNQLLAEVIQRIADLVPRARQAILAQDARSLHALMNENFDLRSSLYPIRPQHRAMIETARSLGASAKFAGSGGSVVGVCSDTQMFQDLQQALVENGSEWKIIRPDIAPPFEPQTYGVSERL
jgi:glucuronokinase